MEVRWHTEGRRQPTLIGKDMAGRRIPGGPYVLWQAAALPVAPLLWSTRRLWAGALPTLPVLILVVGVTGVVFWLIGQASIGNRNPVTAAPPLLRACLRAATPPRRPPPRRRPTTRPAWLPTRTAATAAATATATATAIVLAAAAGVPAAPDAVPPVPAAPAGPVPSNLPPTVGERGRLSPLEQFLAAAGKV